MKNNDYYRILGVSKDASQEDIQRAYRKLARRYHPDVNKTEDAEARFKEINEANEVLKDPGKRKLYDVYGNDWAAAREQGYTGDETRGHHGYEDIFSSFGSGDVRYEEGSEGLHDFFSGLFGGRGAQFSAGRKVYESDIALTLGEVLDAGVKHFSFAVSEIDPASGNYRTKEHELKVRIPKGIVDGSVIRVSDFDKKGSNGSDLLLRVKILKDPRFDIREQDLHTAVSILPWEAALGAKVKVETLDGSVNLNIPPGTAAGRKFRLKGKGLPFRTSGRGDIIVRILIQIPDSINEEERRLFEKLAEKAGKGSRIKNRQSSAQL